MKIFISPVLILSLTLSLILISTQTFASMDPRLAGSWKSEKEVYLLDDAQVFLDVTFNPATVFLTAHCLFRGGQVLSSSVESKVEYGEGFIKTLESKDHVAKDGSGKECPILTRPAQIDYQFQNAHSLTLNDKELGMIVNLIRK